MTPHEWKTLHKHRGRRFPGTPRPPIESVTYLCKVCGLKVTVSSGEDKDEAIRAKMAARGDPEDCDESMVARIMAS